MNKKLIYLIIIAFLAGCGQSGQTKLAISDVSSEDFEPSRIMFDPALMPAVIYPRHIENPNNNPYLQQAIDSWNEFAGFDVFTIEDEVYAVEVSVDVVEDAGGEETLSPYVCNVTVHPSFYYHWEIYAHELGHCLGFGHSSNPDSIMFPNAGTAFTSGLQQLFNENLP